jgi:hypothetical protein
MSTDIDSGAAHLRAMAVLLQAMGIPVAHLPVIGWDVWGERARWIASRGRTGYSLLREFTPSPDGADSPIAVSRHTTSEAVSRAASDLGDHTGTGIRNVADRGRGAWLPCL